MKDFYVHIEGVLKEIKQAGLEKVERKIASPQGTWLTLEDGRKVLNMCANNYLGLANDPRVIQAAKDAMDTYGYGMASVRFICGTQDIHRQLEKELAKFLGMEDAVLYASCFDANGGLFETLLGPEDAVISDSLNHASIIDGIRLCKAKRFRYTNGAMDELEHCLKDAQSSRYRLIATDGVFSMKGVIAPLQAICDLAKRYNAMVMVDDCHATGFFGKEGRGTVEYFDCMEQVDILTSTLGKALGGGIGGFTAAKKPVIDLLRQRSRPYLFSNALPPHVVCATLKVLELLNEDHSLPAKIMEHTRYFRRELSRLGFDITPGEHPIIPVMLYDAPLAQKVASRLLALGVYVVGFSYPVVPDGRARIRVQISAAHTQEDLAFALEGFVKVKAEFGL